MRSYDPPDAQIIDFGCATIEKKMLYDSPGTIPYLAPEQREGLYHDQSVDYWSCGLVGVELWGMKRGSGRVLKEGLKVMSTWIEEQKPHPVLKGCRGMLRMEAAERMTADEVLDEFLDVYRDGKRGVKRAIDAV